MSTPSKRTPTKRDLELLVADLKSKLAIESEQCAAQAADLQAANDTISRLETELADATQRAQDATAAAAAATAALAAAAAANPQAAQAPPPTIPKPAGVLRKLEEISGLSHLDYKAIQRTIRNLAVRADLDVTQDFRRQNPESLAKLYKAAKDDHPVLRQYQNNWLTAELTKQFLQNRRKHAVRQGYIDRAFLKTSARGTPRRRVRETSFEL